MKRFTKRVMDMVAYTGPDAQHQETGDTAAELTTRSARTLLSQLAAYEDTELDPESIKALVMMCAAMKMEIDRLHHFEKVAQGGRLWEAPCKMGTTLYMIVTKRPKLHMPEFSFIKTTYLTEHNFFRVIRDFGKTVFLTMDEAKAALAEKEATQ